MPKVSVIIPVYQSVAYIDRCLDSVRKQTLTDIEIICVNDGSTDGSMEKLRRHATEDDRIVIFDQENQGPSAARNKGLELASGKYICFVDSDDWIDRDFFETLLTRIEAAGTDVATDCSYIMEYPEKGTRSFSSFDWVPENGGKLPSTMVQRLFPPVIWASIYRREYLEANHICFPEVKYGGEDIYFTGVCNLLAGHVYVFRGPAYHYLQRQCSLIRSKGRGFEYLKNFRTMRQKAQEHGASLEGARLFYVESLFIEDEQMFDFTRGFMLELKDEVAAHPEIYSDQDRFLVDVMVNTPDYAAFKAKYNPNISMSFIRSRMAQKR